jgi:hypothetical protein
MPQYIKTKITIFKQLHIPLTETQIEYMLGLKNEIAIDNYCSSLIINSKQY